MFRRICLISLALTIIGSAVFPLTALAVEKTYPNRPVRLVVGVAPGGPVDSFMRLIADKLTQMWHVSVVVENRVGASGSIGAAYVAKAPPDGYTLFAAAINTHGANPALYGSKLAYDAVKDFAPVIYLVKLSSALVVNPDLPILSFKDLIEMAREKPGALTYSSAGIGSTLWLYMEQLKQQTNVDIVHIPYNGAGPAMAAVLGKQVDMIFTGIVTALPQIKAGHVRPIVINNGGERFSELPDVPTLKESGFPKLEAVAWMGIVAPAGTPPQVVNAINAAVNSVLQTTDIKHKFAGMGGTPVGGTPEEFGTFIREEVNRWGELIEKAGVHAE